VRKAGVPYALIPLAILVIGIAFLANHSTSYAALTFNPTYASELCDDLADDTDITNSSCVGSPGENKTADAATETTTHTSWTTPDSNFTFLANTSPPDAVIAPGAAHAIGADMGIIRNLIKLGLGNSVCDNTPTVDFNFQNATTDVTNTTSSWPEGFSDRHGILMMEDSTDDDGDGIYSEDGDVGEQSFASGLPNDYYTAGDDDGDTLLNEDPPDNANGGLPNHVAYYPRWLNDIFDPDLDGLKLDPAANGPQPPLVPYARYSSASLVVGVPVILQFVQFAPGQLTGFPDGNNFNELTTDLGWVNQIILNDTSEVVSAPSSISAFCETQSHTRLFGTVNAVDRYNNPPAGSGLVDPATGLGTNTHLTWLYSQSGRDLDGDGIANADTYDTCATVANPGWDPTALRPQSMDTDSDGIPEVDDVLPSGIGPEDSCDNAIITFPVQIDHESTPESNCTDNVDDDKDGRVNDNCPRVGGVGDEEINQCDNNTDDDLADGGENHAANGGIGWVNDGCAVVQGVGESGGDCANATDDDFDFRVNDGCPAVGAAEVQQCNEAEGFALDDDSDGTINDGCFLDFLLVQAAGDLFLNGDDNCPILFNPLQTQGENSQTWAFATDVNGDTTPDGGPRNDAMGDECDPRPNIADGDYLATAEINAVCISPGTDGDSDGFCDATEDALGSDKTVTGSTPEHDMVQPPFPLARNGALGGVPTACSDGVDNDGDTDVDGADSGCGSAGDGDQDGLADASDDNCPGNDGLALDDPVNVAAYNPTQTDSDGDSLGDACDDDMDADGRTQTHERWTGHDVMADCPVNSNHDAWPFDTNNSGNVNLVDLVGSPSFKGSFGTSQGDPDYFRQFDFNASGNVNLVDLVGTPGSFKNAFGTAC
jgi:hypothetical protein